MIIASISEAKNKLSALLDRVRSGETILVVDRGKPVARIEPAVSAEEDDDGRLARLERAGIVKRGSGKPSPEILLGKPPRPRKGGSVLEALLEERREGR
ncbi:MAG: type II toxin-antitoxin system Phd/YefM family antitoxin [Actinomycetota bacterium]|nr:type II toxin-antitoxin system prevent-host-death family antitoxin [Actinomycetota bacterium]